MPFSWQVEAFENISFHPLLLKAGDPKFKLVVLPNAQLSASAACPSSLTWGMGAPTDTHNQAASMSTTSQLLTCWACQLLSSSATVPEASLPDRIGQRWPTRSRLLRGGQGEPMAETAAEWAVVQQSWWWQVRGERWGSSIGGHGPGCPCRIGINAHYLPLRRVRCMLQVRIAQGGQEQAHSPLHERNSMMISLTGKISRAT